METYPNLVSSQIPHILLYIYTVKQSLCCVYFNYYNTVQNNKAHSRQYIFHLNNVTGTNVLRRH